MELLKGLSIWVLYIGLAIFAIGIFLTFKQKPSSGGIPIIFIGAMIIIFWIPNRKDQLCPIDPNDNTPCTPV